MIPLRGIKSGGHKQRKRIRKKCLIEQSCEQIVHVNAGDRQLQLITMQSSKSEATSEPLPPSEGDAGGREGCKRQKATAKKPPLGGAMAMGPTSQGGRTTATGATATRGAPTEEEAPAGGETPAGGIALCGTAPGGTAPGGTAPGGINTLILRGGFKAISANKNHFRKSTLLLGKTILEANHIDNVEELRQGSEMFTIRAKVLHSVSIREKPYHISFDIHPITRKVLDAKCTCVVGVNGNCKHAAALFTFINEERSDACTDNKQEWHVPSKKLQSLYPKGESLEKIWRFPQTPEPNFSPAKDKISGLKEDLARFHLTDSALYKSLSCETENVSSVPPVPTPATLSANVAALFSSEVFFSCDAHPKEDAPSFLELKCSAEEAKTICEKTIGQAVKKRWFRERAKRISASKAHKIMNARKKDTCLSYFFDHLCDNVHLRYGREMEPVAKEEYAKKTGNILHETGLFVKVCEPWLCASPDAVIETPEKDILVLEIKCPSSCRGKSIDVPYLKNGELKKTHPYYAQVQIQLYCCNVEKAHFYVFSEVDSVLLVIEKDDEFL